MYKFLTDKLNESKGAFVESMALMAFEVLNEDESEMMEDFSSKTFSEICKTLKFRDEKDVHEIISEAIKNKDLSGEIFRSGREGFLAKVNFPVAHHIRFNKESKEISSWSSSQGHCYVDYIYADTIAELVDKISDKADDFFQICIDRQENMTTAE